MVSCELSYRVVETRRAVQAFDGQRELPETDGSFRFRFGGMLAHTRRVH